MDEKALYAAQHRENREDMKVLGYGCLLITLFISLTLVLPVCLTLAYIFGK